MPMSATGDPYFDVERDVKQSIENLHSAFERSQRSLTSGANDIDAHVAQSELMSQLKTVNWDLDDINDSIAMVERNRAKYKLSDADINRRKAFVNDSREVVNRMKASVQNLPVAHRQVHHKNELLRNRDLSRGGNAGSYSAVDRDTGGAGLDGDQQQVMLRAQDEVLDDVIKATRALGQMGENIGQELGQHSQLIAEVTSDVDDTNNKIAIAKQRVEKMLAAQSEQRLMCLVCMLIGVFVTLSFIVFEF
jgi:hypothetical protein